MKIGNSDSPQPLATTTLVTSPAPAPDTKAAASMTPDASVQVELSSAAASLLQNAQETTAAQGDFNAEKVAQVTSAIAQGSFKPNAEAIADKLIANAQELLSKGSS
jgi:negative regulator of flagellin synthesis FlgM